MSAHTLRAVVEDTIDAYVDIHTGRIQLRGALDALIAEAEARGRAEALAEIDALRRRLDNAIECAREVLDYYGEADEMQGLAECVALADAYASAIGGDDG